jgi:branched-chain amino acid transport system substrate-binding protein
VLQLKAEQAGAVIFASYTVDTILYMKTLKTLDYLPEIIGDDAGFTDPSFIPAPATSPRG